jgi:hypothetical protein
MSLLVLNRKGYLILEHGAAGLWPALSGTKASNRTRSIWSLELVTILVTLT